MSPHQARELVSDTGEADRRCTRERDNPACQPVATARVEGPGSDIHEHDPARRGRQGDGAAHVAGIGPGADLKQRASRRAPKQPRPGRPVPGDLILSIERVATVWPDERPEPSPSPSSPLTGDCPERGNSSGLATVHGTARGDRSRIAARPTRRRAVASSWASRPQGW